MADLLGLLLDVNDSSTPIVNVRSHELINLRKELFPDHWRAHEAKHSTPHGLVQFTMDSCNVRPPQHVQHGLGVARNKAFSIIHQNVSVQLWIHAHHCGASKYVCLEQIPIPEEVRKQTSVMSVCMHAQKTFSSPDESKNDREKKKHDNMGKI